ncbi:MAG: protoheme IX farnesyltransferase [Acidobacteria bacterium]|nr:protoheme IX farnesyltransferase [Acidobacteriota bacterium]MBI3656120.1 protoheme IX farnesyltransferase [Acidobacteriota bacterium]
MKEKFVSDAVMVYRPTQSALPWLRQKLYDYAELSKLKLSLLVLFSALVSFFLGVSEPAPLGLLFWFGLGNFLVIAGANALNQVIERDYDALMIRTARRPLPAERMGVAEAFAVAMVMSVGGLFLLTFAVNGLTGSLAAVALLTYVLVYTPLKRKSVWCTFFGAISGAIPPMMGFTAIHGDVSVLAWCLFAILFFWQFPHFWAIAWMFRDDYANAGFRIAPEMDASGVKTGRQVVVFSAILVMVSLAPGLMGLMRPMYLVGAAGLGLLMMWYSIRLRLDCSQAAARRLLLASVFYLPALMMVMLLAKR